MREIFWRHQFHSVGCDGINYARMGGNCPSAEFVYSRCSNVLAVLDKRPVSPIFRAGKI